MIFRNYGYVNQDYLQNLQGLKEKIDSQIRNIQQSQNQIQPQQPITQNFQITPQQNLSELESKYADNINDVKNTFVIKTGVFINRDFSTLWIKDVNGKIRTFVTNEIVEKDEKDIEIEKLKREIEEMKESMKNGNEFINANGFEKTTNAKPTRVQNGKRGNTK